MSNLLGDLRYAFRMLGASPLVTVIAVLSIALAIGANTAVFTLVDQVLLRVLPVKDARRLVQLTTTEEFYGATLGNGTELSYPLYTDLRDHNEVFAGMLCTFPTNLHLTAAGRSERVNAELVSGSYFPVLGVGAAVGRPITESEDRVSGGHPVAVLSHAYWKNRFGGDRGILGKPVTINGQPFTVIGVVEEGFHGLDIGQPTQLFVPFAMQPQLTQRWLKQDDRRFRWVEVFARLEHGVTPEQATAGLMPFFRSVLEKEVADASFAKASADTRRTYLRMRLELLPASQGHSSFRSSLTGPLWILMAVVAGVLLIACANIANLLIARGTARQREIALRLALGAGRLRVVRQLVVEGFVLAAIGGLAGLLVASWGAEFLIAAYTTPDNALTIEASPDVRILVFTMAVVGIATMLCAVVPALQSTRPALTAALKEGANSVAGGSRAGLRKGLVVVQVALSLLLLIGAGLFVRSLQALLAVQPGFAVDDVVSFSLDLHRNGYSAARSKQFSTDLLERVRSTPGVESVAYAFFGLLEGGAWGMPVTVEGRRQKTGENVGALLNAVSPGFLRTLRIPLVSGRDFTDNDVRVAPVDGWPYRVGIANRTFVKRYLEGRNPLGVHVGLSDDPGTPTPIEIVGVVEDAKYTGIRAETLPQLWLPYLESNDVDTVTVYVRARQPDQVIDTVRRIVQQLDSTLPIYGVRTLERTLQQSVATERLVATLSAAFGFLATLLAAVGLYGVMAYRVTQRTREIGVRIALGAVKADVMRRVLREAGVLVVAGLAGGLAASWALSRYVESQLYGLTPTDPFTIGLSVLALTAVAMLAAVLPARRAARIDPMVALRAE